MTTTRHLTADEVFSQLKEEGEDVGLATVYRVLTQFEVAGLLRRRLHGIDAETVMGHHGVGIFWNVETWTLD